MTRLWFVAVMLAYLALQVASQSPRGSPGNDSPPLFGTVYFGGAGGAQFVPTNRDPAWSSGSYRPRHSFSGYGGYGGYGRPYGRPGYGGGYGNSGLRYYGGAGYGNPIAQLLQLKRNFLLG